MELRSNSRSRSRTPFVQSLQQTELFSSEGNEYEETVVRTTRSTTIKSFETSANSSTRNVKGKNSNKSEKSALARRIRHKTSDYSSEEGETDVTSSHVSENEKNQLIEDAKLAANGSAEISALELYRKAGRYWDVYPKTDWTYSRSSRDRVELAPGVVAMPNMSRRSLHSQERTVDHLLTHHTTQNTYTAPISAKYRNSRTLFTDNNYNENYEYEVYTSDYQNKRVTIWSRIVGVFLMVYQTIWSLFYRTMELQGSWLLALGKRVHRAASLLFLCDTWLLRVWDGRRRRNDKLNGVLLLCLVPLLLFGGWYLVSTLGGAIYGSYFNATNNRHVRDTNNPPFTTITDLTDDDLEKIALYLKQHQQQAKSDELLPIREEMERMRVELKNLESNKNADINRLLTKIDRDNLRLMSSLRRCCKTTPINIETYVSKAVEDYFAHAQNRDDLALWLRTIFVAKDDLQHHLTNVTENLKVDFDAALTSSGKKIMDEVVGRISLQLNERVVGDRVELTDEYVRGIVKDVLDVYDADMTGLVDFAMEPMGGQVITTRCTESYQAGTAVVSILGIPLWYPTNTPRTVITPGINPGECWAFQNFPGFLVIKLAAPIRISAFSYEHISRKLIANGKIDSAPKDFEVYGLRNETDAEPLLLGSFRYDYDGESLQFFASVIHELVFEMIELRVLSNHGNPNYTCLYRFRVHGSVEPT